MSADKPIRVSKTAWNLMMNLRSQLGVDSKKNAFDMLVKAGAKSLKIKSKKGDKV